MVGSGSWYKFSIGGLAKKTVLILPIAILAFAMTIMSNSSETLLALPILISIGLIGIAIAILVVVNRKVDIWSWREESREKVLISIVLLTVFVGGVYLVSAVTMFADPTLQVKAYRTACLWALAYAGAGFLVGFLFGIPRVLQGQDAAIRVDGRVAGQPSDYAQRVNTNLEQISDWLTKIIVGIGLVELRQVPDHLYKASMWMASSFSLKKGEDLAQAASFSNGVIIFFSVAGFLSGYIITRVFLAGAFGRADTGVQKTVAPFKIEDADKINVEKLRKFWMPSESGANPENEKKLLDWLTGNGLNTSEKPTTISSFINQSVYAKERSKAVQDLNL